MTRPKNAELPQCKVILMKPIIIIGWFDQGRERVSARITKALRAEGYETSAAKDSRYWEGKRLCEVQTNAPIEVVRPLLDRFFLDVIVEEFKEPKGESAGTAADLI